MTDEVAFWMPRLRRHQSELIGEDDHGCTRWPEDGRAAERYAEPFHLGAICSDGEGECGLEPARRGQPVGHAASTGSHQKQRLPARHPDSVLRITAET